MSSFLQVCCRDLQRTCRNLDTSNYIVEKVVVDEPRWHWEFMPTLYVWGLLHSRVVLEYSRTTWQAPFYLVLQTWDHTSICLLKFTYNSIEVATCIKYITRKSKRYLCAFARVTDKSASANFPSSNSQVDVGAWQLRLCQSWCRSLKISSKHMTCDWCKSHLPCKQLYSDSGDQNSLWLLQF